MCDTCTALRHEVRELRDEIEAWRAEAAARPMGDADRVGKWATALRLSARQARALIALVDTGATLTREQLLPIICLTDAHGGSLDRSVDTQIKRLRRALEANVGHQVWITAIYGLGYNIAPDAARILRTAVGEASSC